MSCLDKRSGKEANHAESDLSLPGTMYTADQQCKMRFNESYIFYQDESRVYLVSLTILSTINKMPYEKCAFKSQIWLNPLFLFESYFRSKFEYMT